MPINSLSIPVQVRDADKTVETFALIDSGAGGKFIDQNYVRRLGIKTQELEQPLIARNVDGTPNKKGKITSFVTLVLIINGRTKRTRLLVTGLGNQKIILGFPWLREQNPIINWQTGEFTWRNQIFQAPKGHRLNPMQLAKALVRKQLGYGKPKERTIAMEETDEQEHLNHTQNSLPDTELATLLTTILGNISLDLWINAKTTTATTIQAEINQQKEDLPLTDQIPKEYHRYLDVFDEVKAERFSESRPWDHKIELKEGFQPKSFKTYNLTPEEQKELDNWIKENLEKGYIRPSQSPMASPFFYVKKKDGKLRPCQDYRYLNDSTSNSFTLLDIKWFNQTLFPDDRILSLTKTRTMRM